MSKRSVPLKVMLTAVVLLVLSGCADASPFLCCRGGPTAAVAITQSPPPAPGLARVWFLHQFEPTESTAVPTISANGAPVGNSEPGTAFYRDFAAGRYSFAVPSDGIDFGQTADLRLEAGAQVFLEIQSLRSWGACGENCARDTLYVRRVSADWAALYLPTLIWLAPVRS